MTPQQKTVITSGVKISLVVALVVALANATREYIIYRPEFNAHLQVENSKLDALLTLQCRVTPDDTICRAYR